MIKLLKSRKEIKISNSTIVSLFVTQKAVAFLLNNANHEILYANVRFEGYEEDLLKASVFTEIYCNEKTMIVIFSFFIQRIKGTWQCKDPEITYQYVENQACTIQIKPNGEYCTDNYLSEKERNMFQDYFNV